MNWFLILSQKQILSWIIYKQRKEQFKPSSEFEKWPVEVMTTGKKDAMKSSWIVGNVLSLPFPRNVMSRSEFNKNFLFLSYCSNTKYPNMGQPGYDPRKKLRKLPTILQEQLASV